MRVLAIGTGQPGSIIQVRVSVRNRSSNALTPHFLTDPDGAGESYWHLHGGPVTLAAHQSAVYTLIAPDTQSMPGIGEPFDVDAITADPRTFSSSSRFVPQPYAVTLTPSAVEEVMHPDQSVTFTAQLQTAKGATLRKAGVRIIMWQNVYIHSKPVPGGASVNAGSPHKTASYAVTGRDGSVRFRVTDRHPQRQPIYFQVAVAPRGSYLFGYTGKVSVIWR
jgi:hypothetical protein